MSGLVRAPEVLSPLRSGLPGRGVGKLHDVYDVLWRARTDEEREELARLLTAKEYFLILGTLGKEIDRLESGVSDGQSNTVVFSWGK